MAKAQRDISVSEFFAKNRHLLGFDNPRKALLTTVKEAVDNALDACEEAGILPTIIVRIEQIDEDHYKVGVEDNGPGIVKAQIPNIFGKLLYGSKFHRLRMSRGQQGIGISAAGMYGLLTTGQPIKITSRTKRGKSHFYSLTIDTKMNRPNIVGDEQVDWDVPHGTKVEIEMEARYQRGRQSVDEYLRQTAIANPHVTLHYYAPDGKEAHYEASISELPATPKEVKPHPHGVELGVFIKMLQDSKAKTAAQFLSKSFSRVSSRVARKVLEAAGLTARSHPNRLAQEAVKDVYQRLQDEKILAPSTDCVVPIGEEQLVAGLKQVVDAAFYTAVSRKPSVYRGNPFVVEAAIAYGKPETKAQKEQRLEQEIEAEANGEDEDDTSLAHVLRLANRVPLQYQQGACAITKSVVGTNWRGYGLQQGRGALPSGDLTIVVHMASVWVPFTSESKEAVASYPEILKELRLALQECGRRLGSHIRKTIRIRRELKKRSYIEKYIPAIGEALKDMLDLSEKQTDDVCENLKDVLERSRKM
ncbi:MAG: DNA topoisomerase VI subunit B [Planctomycetes bacterium]|nr:DNA topoisomerase VI subunit B [Planctomycetota bacterium]